MTLIHERVKDQHETFQAAYKMLSRVERGEIIPRDEISSLLHTFVLWIDLTQVWKYLLKRDMELDRLPQPHVDPRPDYMVALSAFHDIFEFTQMCGEIAEEKKRDESLSEIERERWQGKADMARLVLAQARNFPEAMVSSALASER